MQIKFCAKTIDCPQHRTENTKSNSNKTNDKQNHHDGSSPRPRQLVGWITNLLVAPEYRRRGYAQALVLAAENLALQRWRLTSMHLHCDADQATGLSAQRLYMEQLGYGTIRNNDGKQQQAKERENNNNNNGAGSSSSEDYSWMNNNNNMGPANCDSSVFVIQGIPLLYLFKDLQ